MTLSFTALASNAMLVWYIMALCLSVRPSVTSWCSLTRASAIAEERRNDLVS